MLSAVPAVPLLAEFRTLDRRIWSLASARLVMMGGSSMVIPFLGIHLAIERKVPAVVVGLIWSVAGACGAALQWGAGELADRIGRRPLMLSAMVLRALNLLGLGLATRMGPSSLAVVLIGALVVASSMLRALFEPAANALIADLSPPEQRVAAFSLQRVGTNIGWASGPAIAGLFAGASYSTLFLCSVPVTAIATAIIWKIDAPHTASAARPPSWRELLAFRGDRAFVRFLAATLCFFVLQAQLYQTLSIYAARVLHLSRAQVGTFYTLNGLLVVCLQLPLVGTIRRIGTRRALLFGCLGYAASYAFMGLATSYAFILGCVACVTLSEIITAPAQQTTVTTLAPPGRMGAYSGLFGLCQIAAQSAGPLIGTGALDLMAPRAAWFVLAAFGVTAGFTYRSAAAHPACAPLDRATSTRAK